MISAKTGIGGEQVVKDLNSTKSKEDVLNKKGSKKWKGNELYLSVLLF